MGRYNPFRSRSTLCKIKWKIQNKENWLENAQQKSGTKVYSTKGTDFRVNVDESLIVIITNICITALLLSRLHSMPKAGRCTTDNRLLI